MAAPSPMTPSGLASYIGQQIQLAKSYMENEIASDISKNLRYSLGEPFGNEVDGHSSVVSTDVFDTIESLMPDLMEIFNSGPAVRYVAKGQEDEAIADQLTDYVNDIVWGLDNDGYKLTHDWCKDTLYEKNGVLKMFWDEKEETQTDQRKEVPLSEVTRLDLQDDTEVVEAKPSEDDAGNLILVPIPYGPMEPAYDVTVKTTRDVSRLKVYVIPHEEFGIPSRDTELDETATFPYHVIHAPRSYFIERGFDEEVIFSLPTNDDLMTDRSRRTARARNANQRDALTFGGLQDTSMQKVKVYECYPLMDMDGDGEAKRYLVWAGGEDGNTLLRDPETGEIASDVDDHPFVDMTAYRLPHRWAGLAVADLLRSIQEIKSTLERQNLDSLYNANNQRAAVSNKVSLDDWLNNEVGGTVEVDTDNPDVGGHFQVLTNNFLGPDILPVLEYYNGVAQKRSGVTSDDALDPEMLHKTATGANLVLGERHKRMLYMVRMMAETGFVNAFRKMLKILQKNQDKPRTVRLRNEWVTVDPAQWSSLEFDVRPVVGLGHGTRSDKVVTANAIIEKQTLLIQAAAQGAIPNYVMPDDIWNSLDLFTSNLNAGDTDRYFTPPQPPDPNQQGQEKPDPAMMKLQLEAQDSQADNQREDLKAIESANLDRWKAETEAAQRKWRDEEDARIRWAELRLKYGLKAEELDRETALEVAQMAVGDPAGQGNIPSPVNGSGNG